MVIWIIFVVEIFNRFPPTVFVLSLSFSLQVNRFLFSYFWLYCIFPFFLQYLPSCTNTHWHGTFNNNMEQMRTENKISTRNECKHGNWIKNWMSLKFIFLFFFLRILDFSVFKLSIVQISMFNLLSLFHYKSVNGRNIKYSFLFYSFASVQHQH